MNQYTLDYSNPRPPTQRSHRQLNQTLPQVMLLVCGLAFSVAFVSAIRMRADVRFHQNQYQAQAVRYDSLLAAKAEVDRQLQRLNNMLAQTSSKP